MDVTAIWREQADYDAYLDTLDLGNPDIVRREMEKLRWWHPIQLTHGIVTPGRTNAQLKLQQMQLPDLNGKRVLDIGAWDGFFSFEAEKRGAAQVTALDLARPKTFELAKRVLHSNVRFLERDFLRLSRDDFGSYHVVLCLGVIYHVPNLIDLLERLAQVTEELLILETATTRNWSTAPVAEFRAPPGALNGLDSYGPNWWIPSVSCLEGMLRAVGFGETRQLSGPRPSRSHLETTWRMFSSRILRREEGSRVILHATRN